MQSHYLYVFADGTYFTVIYGEEGCKMPILAVVGIDETGKRKMLAFTVGERENQQAWEALLENLKNRGVQQIDLWITDGNQAMLNAIQNKFPASQRQRCIKHEMDNILGYVPKTQQEVVRAEPKAIFYSTFTQLLTYYQTTAPYHRRKMLMCMSSDPLALACSEPYA